MRRSPSCQAAIVSASQWFRGCCSTTNVLDTWREPFVPPTSHAIQRKKNPRNFGWGSMDEKLLWLIVWIFSNNFTDKKSFVYKMKHWKIVRRMAEAQNEDSQTPQRPLASQFSQLSLTIECGRINSSLSLLKPNPYVEVTGIFLETHFK